MMHKGVEFQYATVYSQNPHRFAEMERYAVRSKVAHLLTQALRLHVKSGGKREELDFVILWPSGTEVAAFREIMYVTVDGVEFEVRCDGYRMSLLGSDMERGRIIYPTSLFASTRYVCGDGLYYLDSEGFCRMFAEHPSVKQGLTFFMSGRYFCASSDSLYVDQYHFNARPSGTVVKKEAYQKKAPATFKNGDIKTNKKGAEILKLVTCYKNVTVEYPELGAVDEIEGHGLVDSDGEISYFASCSPGDSVYKHKLPGMFFFTHSKKAVCCYFGGTDIRFYQISIHLEWTCVNLHVLCSSKKFRAWEKLFPCLECHVRLSKGA
jgi:hypothetical protein